MISNPNYNYDKDISVVKAEYHKLTEEQKWVKNKTFNQYKSIFKKWVIKFI